MLQAERIVQLTPSVSDPALPEAIVGQFLRPCLQANRLNNRPRKILDFETPNEVFARMVEQAHNTKEQCCAST
jgi:hypothetical protein